MCRATGQAGVNDVLRKSPFRVPRDRKRFLWAYKPRQEEQKCRSVLSVSPELGLTFLSGLHTQSAQGCCPGSGITVETRVLILAPRAGCIAQW